MRINGENVAKANIAAVYHAGGGKINVVTLKPRYQEMMVDLTERPALVPLVIRDFVIKHELDLEFMPSGNAVSKEYLKVAQFPSYVTFQGIHFSANYENTEIPLLQGDETEAKIDALGKRLDNLLTRSWRKRVLTAVDIWGVS